MNRIITLLLLGVGLLSACTDQLPTDAARAENVEAGDMGGLPAVQRTAALGGVEDALERIIPHLSDRQAAHQLAAALGGLRTALDNADNQAVGSLVTAAESAVQRYAGNAGDAADVDAIRLALAFAREALAH